MKLSNAYKVKGSETHDSAVKKVRYRIADRLMEKITVRIERIAYSYESEYRATVHVYSEDSVTEMLRELQTLRAKAIAMNQGEPRRINRIIELLTSNKF